MMSARDFKSDIQALIPKLQDDDYAKAFYRAICNMRWVSQWEATNEEYSCTWRFAGGLVAQMRNKGENYLDFYCSGGEGIVRDDVLRDLWDLGWEPKAWGDD